MIFKNLPLPNFKSNSLFFAKLYLSTKIVISFKTKLLKNINKLFKKDDLKEKHNFHSHFRSDLVIFIFAVKHEQRHESEHHRTNRAWKSDNIPYRHYTRKVHTIKRTHTIQYSYTEWCGAGPPRRAGT